MVRVVVSLLAAATVAVAAATVAMAVRSSVRVVEDEQAHEVDAETQHRNEQQSVVVDLDRLVQTRKGLDQHRDGDKDQKDRVDEGRQHVDATISIREQQCSLVSIEREREQELEVN